MQLDQTTRRWLAATNAILALAVFAGDLAIQLGIAGGVLYAGTVLVAMWLSGRMVYVFAIAGTLLTALGYLVSPYPGGWEEIANRSIGIAATWGVALLGLRVRGLARDVLRQSRIIEEVQDGILVTSRHGLIEYCNRGALRIFRSAQKQLAGRGVAGLFEAPDEQGIDRLFKEPLESSGPLELNLRARRSDGEPFEALAWLMQRFDDTGKPNGVITYIADRSDQTPADEAARKVESFYRDLLDVLPLQVALFDREGRFLYLNPASLSSPDKRRWIIGRTEREYFESVGRNLALADVREAHLSRAVDRKELVTFEEEFRAKSGEVRRFMHSFFPVLDGAGEIDRVLGFRFDITDLKKAESALRTYASRLEGLRKIDHAILSAQSPESVAEVAARHLLAMTSADEVDVSIIDEGDETVSVVSVREGNQARIEVVSLDAFQSVIEAAGGRGADFRDTSKTGGGTGAIEAGEEAAASRLDIPLVAQDALVGTLSLKPERPEGFDLPDVEVARDVAVFLAVAIHDTKMFEQVDKSRGRLQALSMRLVQVQEDERRSLARELHDEIGQALTGLKLTLDAASRHVNDTTSGRLADASEIVRSLLARVRDISLDLRPAMLDDLGLVPALVWLVDRYKRQTGIEVRLKHGIDHPLEPDMETAAYRIIQEALTNVARHSQTDYASVLVQTVSGTLTVSVVDRGVGFDLRSALSSHSSNGLSGIQERVSLLGGTLTVETAPEQGTCLTAIIPIPEALP